MEFTDWLERERRVVRGAAGLRPRHSQSVRDEEHGHAAPVVEGYHVRDYEEVAADVEVHADGRDVRMVEAEVGGEGRDCDVAPARMRGASDRPLGGLRHQGDRARLRPEVTPAPRLREVPPEPVVLGNAVAVRIEHALVRAVQPVRVRGLLVAVLLQIGLVLVPRVGLYLVRGQRYGRGIVPLTLRTVGVVAAVYTRPLLERALPAPLGQGLGGLQLRKQRLRQQVPRPQYLFLANRARMV